MGAENTGRATLGHKAAIGNEKQNPGPPVYLLSEVEKPQVTNHR